MTAARYFVRLMDTFDSDKIFASYQADYVSTNTYSMMSDAELCKRVAEHFGWASVGRASTVDGHAMSAMIGPGHFFTGHTFYVSPPDVLGGDGVWQQAPDRRMVRWIVETIHSDARSALVEVTP